MEYVALLVAIIVMGWSIQLAFRGRGEDLVNEEIQVEVQSLPYRQKERFFTKSEFQFFVALNAALDARNYTIFPKVRLGDIIEVPRHAASDITWWNKIRAKHVDFAIWNLVDSRLELVVELDGSSHTSVHSRKSDAFIDRVLEVADVCLKRVAVGEDFQSVALSINTEVSTRS